METFNNEKTVKNNEEQTWKSNKKAIILGIVCVGILIVILLFFSIGNSGKKYQKISRGAELGMTKDEVIALEEKKSDSGNYKELDGYDALIYDNITFFDYKACLIYYFDADDSDKLKNVFITIEDYTDEDYENIRECIIGELGEDCEDEEKTGTKITKWIEDDVRVMLTEASSYREFLGVSILQNDETDSE